MIKLGYSSSKVRKISHTTEMIFFLSKITQKIIKSDNRVERIIAIISCYFPRNNLRHEGSAVWLKTVLYL